MKATVPNQTNLALSTGAVWCLGADGNAALAATTGFTLTLNVVLTCKTWIDFIVFILNVCT